MKIYVFVDAFVVFDVWSFWDGRVAKAVENRVLLDEILFTSWVVEVDACYDVTWASSGGCLDGHNKEGKKRCERDHFECVLIGWK